MALALQLRCLLNEQVLLSLHLWEVIMKNWRRLFIGTLSAALLTVPFGIPFISNVAAEQQKEGQSSQSQGKSDEQSKGKSATGQPSAGGPQGEDKAGGGGPSGPQATPPAKAPQFEGANKGANKGK